MESPQKRGSITGQQGTQTMSVQWHEQMATVHFMQPSLQCICTYSGTIIQTSFIWVLQRPYYEYHYNLLDCGSIVALIYGSFNQLLLAAFQYSIDRDYE